MRSLGWLLAFGAAACSSGDRPKSPREVISEFGKAYVALDYDAIASCVHGDEIDRAYLEAIFDFTRAARAFQRRFVEIHGLPKRGRPRLDAQAKDLSTRKYSSNGYSSADQECHRLCNLTGIATEGEQGREGSYSSDSGGSI